MPYVCRRTQWDRRPSGWRWECSAGDVVVGWSNGIRPADLQVNRVVFILKSTIITVFVRVSGQNEEPNTSFCTVSCYCVLNAKCVLAIGRRSATNRRARRHRMRYVLCTRRAAGVERRKGVEIDWRNVQWRIADVRWQKARCISHTHTRTHTHTHVFACDGLASRAQLLTYKREFARMLKPGAAITIYLKSKFIKNQKIWMLRGQRRTARRHWGLE